MCVYVCVCILMHLIFSINIQKYTDSLRMLELNAIESISWKV